METLKGLCVGFHTLFKRGSFGLSILIAVVTIGICPSARSDTEAHRQAAEQVLKLTNTRRVLEPMIRQMQQRQLKQLEEMNLPDEANVITGKYILQMNELLKADTSIYTRVCFRQRNWESLFNVLDLPLVRRW